MKKLNLILSLSIALILFSCNTTPSQEETSSEAMPIVEETEVEAPLNVDSVVALINQTRADIEANLEAPLEVSTKGLKAKIQQKWSNIHFYTNNGEVVRIKTYPHAAVSERTEEFYLDNGQLILAVIEDEGAGEKGKSEEEIDKMYYFHQGEIIKEAHSTEEKEYSVKESDGEELLAELNEYFDIYKAQ